MLSSDTDAPIVVVTFLLEVSTFTIRTPGALVEALGTI
jgi:hypothetical protein